MAKVICNIGMVLVGVGLVLMMIVIGVNDVSTMSLKGFYSIPATGWATTAIVVGGVVAILADLADR